jgi:Cu-Zn family superoxide dismutase
MKQSILMNVLIGSLLLAWPAYASVGVVKIKGTAKDSPITGEVVIHEKDDGIDVDATVKNVPNPGKHGFHFHEVGQCDDEGKAAGGHFNPEKTKHGFLPKDGRLNAHAGDMGNIEIGPDGKGTLKLFLPGVYLSKTPSVGGVSVILHEKEDDFSQPTGNAGGRIACGVVELKDHYVKEDQDEDEDDSADEKTETPSNVQTNGSMEPGVTNETSPPSNSMEK